MEKIPRSEQQLFAERHLRARLLHIEGRHEAELEPTLVLLHQLARGGDRILAHRHIGFAKGHVVIGSHHRLHGGHHALAPVQDRDLVADPRDPERREIRRGAEITEQRLRDLQPDARLVLRNDLALVSEKVFRTRFASEKNP
jgi:hypothetical protein